MRKLIIPFLIIVSFFQFSCKKDNLKPGYFILVGQEDYLKSSQLDSTPSVEGIDFKLGTIKASKSFYFLVLNGGDAPIYDVKLSFDKNSFLISPTDIKTVAPSELANSPSMINTISIGVQHGIRIEGIGSANLLPMGLNVGTLTISGKTLSEGDTIEIREEFSFSVEAKLMDVDIYEGKRLIDLTNPYGSLNGIYRMFDIGKTTDSVTVHNSGNVPIKLSVGPYGLITTTWEMQPGDRNTVFAKRYITFFIFEGDGVITDIKKIPLNDEGNGILVITRPDLWLTGE